MGRFVNAHINRTFWTPSFLYLSYKNNKCSGLQGNPNHSETVL